MLLFIELALKVQERFDWFQYISCCYLSILTYMFNSQIQVSIHLMLLFIMIAAQAYPGQVCFNTSHVVIYPG